MIKKDTEILGSEHKGNLAFATDQTKFSDKKVR